MPFLQQLVFASHNAGKIQRYRAIFADIADKTLSLAELGITNKPEEKGQTAEENAGIKARYYYNQTGLPTFSSDESLFVDFLPADKQPGVFVRRINGKNDASDDELFEYWHRIIPGISPANRTGFWHVAYAIALSEHNIVTVAHDHRVRFFDPPSEIRIGGWPMSSLEGPIEYNKPHSELTEVERTVAYAESDKKLHELLYNELKGIPKI